MVVAGAIVYAPQMKCPRDLACLTKQVVGCKKPATCFSPLEFSARLIDVEK
jgi:hypothetical protein